MLRGGPVQQGCLTRAVETNNRTEREVRAANSAADWDDICDLWFVPANEARHNTRDGMWTNALGDADDSQVVDDPYLEFSPTQLGRLRAVCWEWYQDIGSPYEESE